MNYDSGMVSPAYSVPNESEDGVGFAHLSWVPAQDPDNRCAEALDLWKWDELCCHSDRAGEDAVCS